MHNVRERILKMKRPIEKATQNTFKGLLITAPFFGTFLAVKRAFDLSPKDDTQFKSRYNIPLEYRKGNLPYIPGGAT